MPRVQSRSGTVVNGSFTIGPAPRYSGTMIGLAFLAAAVAAQPAAPPRELLVQQARATVRILPGARVTADEIPAYAQVKESETRAPDGSPVKSRLVEFP